MNYPNRMKVNQNEIIEEKPIQFANRGMDFEKAVNSSNLFYDDQKRAIITKRPTPIHIVKVDYQDHWAKSKKHILKSNQLLTTMAFTKENISILNVKKLNQQLLYLSIILLLIKLSI